MKEEEKEVVAPVAPYVHRDAKVKIGARPSCLLDEPETSPTYIALRYRYMCYDWIPLGLSAKIADQTGKFMVIEYNKEGQLRRKLKDGTYRDINLHGRVFQLGTQSIFEKPTVMKKKDGTDRKKIEYKPKKGRIRRYIYMPRLGEICVGNGAISYRCDTIQEARALTGEMVMVDCTVNGWKCERGWPQPHVMGCNTRHSCCEYLKVRGFDYGW